MNEIIKKLILKFSKMADNCEELQKKAHKKKEANWEIFINGREYAYREIVRELWKAVK